MNDYPCPECGFDGPHTLVDTFTRSGREIETYECGRCVVEFEVDPAS